MITKETVDLFVNNVVQNIDSPMKDVAFFAWSNLCTHSANKKDYATLKLFEYMATETKSNSECYFYQEEQRIKLAECVTTIQDVAKKLHVCIPLETKLYIGTLACGDMLAQEVLTKVVAAHTWQNKNVIQMQDGICGTVMTTLAETTKLFSHKFFYKKDLESLMRLIRLSDTSTIFDDIDFDWIKQINPRNSVPIDNEGFQSSTIEIIPNSPCNKIFSTYRIFQNKQEFTQYKYYNIEQQSHHC